MAWDKKLKSIYEGNLTMGKAVARPAAADPVNVWQTLYTIAGGLVAITSLISVRTVIQAGGASTMQYRHSVGNTVLDAGTLSVAAAAVGGIVFLTGDATDPLILGAAGAPVMAAKVVATSTRYGSFPLIIVGAGNIQVTMTAAAGTGSSRYIITYVPLDEGAVIIPA